MNPTTSGRFRVQGVDPETVRLLDLDDYEPTTAVRGADLSALEPGYVIEGEIEWEDEEPHLVGAEVVRRTLFAYVDDATNLFEAAEDAWANARVTGDGMNSTVTRDTDGEENGVLYVFAARGATGDVYEEFVDGRRPLEPLVDRVHESEGIAPREVFVMRPANDPFVIVYICLDKGGLLADTMRDTYDAPRPEEG